MGVSDYRGNANPLPGSQVSNKEILVANLPVTPVPIGATSTLLLAAPRLFNWLLLWNFSAFPAVVGQGTVIAPGDFSFVNPIPFAPMYAIANGGAATRFFYQAK